MEKVSYVNRKGVWKEVDVRERWGRTGKEPVTVKWVHTDKGESGEVKIRSRLVAMHLRTKGDKNREDFSAATLLLEPL